MAGPAWPETPAGFRSPKRAGRTPTRPCPSVRMERQCLGYRSGWRAKTLLKRDGFMWMLHGDMGEDNTTPMVMKKSDAKDPSQWIESGPHLMLMPKDPASLSKFTDDLPAANPM